MRTALRTAGIVVAVISAAVAVFLVVFSEASRSAQFGMLLGFWAALILAFSLVRTHEPAAASDQDGGDHHSAGADGAYMPSAALEVPAAPAPTIEDLAAGMAVELRRSAELERQNAEIERREFALKLELMLRREVELVMTAQMADLRQEIAGLRGEILDNVGGQLRLERIETTRLIGSDVQALHQEIRRLVDARDEVELAMDEQDDGIIEAQVVPEPAPEPEPEPEPEPAPEPEPEPEPAPEPEPEPAPEPEPEPEPAPEPEPEPEPAPEPEPVPEPEPAPEPEPVPEPAPARRSFDFADLPSVSRLTPLPAMDPPRYAGRRRAAGADPEPEVPAPRGGQRRARDDSTDDVLARLLGR